jgi:hypothetical protein
MQTSDDINTVTINTGAGMQIIFGANDASLKAYILNPKN